MVNQNKAVKKIKSIYKSLKSNSYSTRILFYQNPTGENNYVILKKIADINEMSVIECINCLIEEKRIKYFPNNNNSQIN